MSDQEKFLELNGHARIINATKNELIKTFHALGVLVWETEREVGSSGLGCQNEDCDDCNNVDESYHSEVKEIVSSDDFVFLGFQCRTCTKISLEFVNATEYYK